MHRTILPLAALVLALSAAACGGGGAARPSGAPAPGGVVAATQPAAAVEQFIGLAAQQRYTEMGYVFGTARGPGCEVTGDRLQGTGYRGQERPAKAGRLASFRHGGTSWKVNSHGATGAELRQAR